MVAVAQLIPDDPQEQASVLAVLREHPELRGFIAKATTKAEELFPGATMYLDTTRYDEWDPPLTLIVNAPAPWPEYQASRDTFIHWLVKQPEFDLDRMLVMPQWTGDLDTAP